MSEIEPTTRREFFEETKKTERGIDGIGSINTEDPNSIGALKMKLYYMVSTQRVDLWEEQQRKLMGSINDETVLRWIKKEMKDITDEDRREMALEAFHSALAIKDASGMSDILKREQLELQTKDIAELIERDLFEVIKTIIDKPLAISRKIKKDLQCPKYHRAERVLNILGFESKEQYLEAGDIVDYMMDNGMSDSKLERFLSYFVGTCDMSALRSLLIHEKERAAEKFYQDGKAVAMDVIMLVALEYKCFGFLLLYMKANNYELSDDSVVTQLFAKIVKLFEEDLTHAEFYLYIMRKYYKYMPYNSAKELINTVNDWIQSQQLKVPFVLANVNPTKTCVLLVELLQLLKKDNDTLEKWIDNMVDDLTELAVLLINEVHDDNELHEIFMDMDLDGRPMIQIAAFNDILNVFKHKSITTVTDKIWSGPYVSRGIPAPESSWLFLNLIHNPVSRLDLFFRQFPKLFSRDYMSYPTHNFQFVTWRDGLQCRYMIESLFYLFVFIFGYYLVYTITSHARSAYIIITMRKGNEEPPTLQEQVAIASDFKNMLDYLRELNTFLLLLFIVNFRHCVMIIFSFLTKRRLASFYAEMALDTLMNIGIIFYYFNVYNDFNDLFQYSSNLSVFTAKMTDFWDNNSWTVSLFAYFTLIAFLRSLNTLEVHNTIGPFIEMMKQMVMKVGTFSILFVTLLFFFAILAAVYLPYSIIAFRSIYRSAVTLFQTSIGVFDINTFGQDMKSEFFTVIYVVIFNILLLNLLIAILTQVYTTITEEADMLYVNGLVILNAINSPHEKYGSLIASYPPLNFFFGIFFLPFLAFTPSPYCERLNNLFLRIEYTLTFMLVAAVYLAVELLFYALCYLKVTVHFFVLMFIGEEYTTSRRVFNFFLFLTLGWLLLFPVLVSDMLYLTLHCYKHPGDLRFMESTREPISKRVLMKLKKFICDVRKRYSSMPWEALRKSLYDLCSIDLFSRGASGSVSPRIEGSASPSAESPSLVTQKSKFKNYKNFTIAAQLLKQCSVYDDDEAIVDLETLSRLLENYTFIIKLRKRQSILLNVDIRSALRQSNTSYAKRQQLVQPLSNNSSIQASDRSGAALISMRAEGIEAGIDEQHILMKLFLTYNLDKYTNALISFKNSMNVHWLAKNALLMGQDVKAAKRGLSKGQPAGAAPTAAPVEEKPQKKTKRGSDPGSREDSLMVAAPESKNANASFTMQELDDILKNVETNYDKASGRENPSARLTVPPHSVSKSPVKSMSPEEAKFSYP